MSGLSRDTIYRYRRLFMEGGIDAFKGQDNTELRHKIEPIKSWKP